MAAMFDWVKQTVVGAPGSGAIELGAAVPGFATLEEVSGNYTKVVLYTVIDGDNKEIGVGRQSGSELLRYRILSKIQDGVFTKDPATPLVLTSAAILGFSPVAATHNGFGCHIGLGNPLSVLNDESTAVVFDRVTYDSGGFFDSEQPSFLQVPRLGDLFVVSACIVFDYNATGVRRAYMHHHQSEFTVAEQVVAPVAGSSQPTRLYMTSGVREKVITGTDTISISAYQNSGAPLNILSGLSWAEVRMVHHHFLL